MTIIFIATGEFGARILEKLAQTEYKPVVLICPPDAPVGRKQILTPCSAKNTAIKQKIGILELKTLKNNNSLGAIKKFASDLIIATDTNFILPKAVLDLPKFECLNIHPSLLPKYRGSSPIQSTISAGDEETGATIIKMDERIDHGAIVANAKFKIQNPKLRYESLRNILADLGAELLIASLPLYLEGKIKPIAQDESKATFTHFIKKEDGLIDWQKPAQEIERQIRAYHLWPKSYTFFLWKGQKKRLVIIEAQILNVKSQIINPLPKNASPGILLKLENKKPAVWCGRDILVLEKLQPEGKQTMTGEAFLNGYQELVGKKFA